MAVLMVAVFTALVVITRGLCLDRHHVSAFWPANGALVAALLLLPWRASLPVAFCCFASNVAINLFTSYTRIDCVLLSALNIFVSCLAALLTRQFCGATTDLSRFRRMASFAVVAFVSAAVEAGLGEAIHLDRTTRSDLVNDWLQWTLCDGFGLLMATPAIFLAVKGAAGRYPCAAGPRERWLLIIGTAALTMASLSFARSPSFLLIYPLLVLTAFRAGPPWVFASILVTALICSAMTAHGFGPLALLSSNRMLLGQSMVEPFLLSIFLTAVPANNALGEKARAARRLLQLKEAVEHSATHDSLTSLANRNLFERRLGAMLRGLTPCAVLLIDLDRFKQVNDTWGHGAGDELLRRFSKRLRRATAADAAVARFGGDEFAILLPFGGDRTRPEELCRRIIEEARAPFTLAGGHAHVSASIGFVAVDAREADASEVMRRADIALYAAKAAGRDGYREFSDELDRATRERAVLEADLRTALACGNQLELHYQSKVDRGGTVVGVEALLRWRHPASGMVPANLVISVAEETGLIIPLGAWIMHEALGFAARWPQLAVAVNVSPVQLRHPSFVETTLTMVRDAGLSPARLELEVTETALMDDLNVISGKLSTLRDAGLSIALDDFGTGYSSLRHLHRCTVDRVKIDQSFVRALGSSDEAAAIVVAVIQLGHAVGLQVTAEGVETEAQRRFLLDAGADELQGYLFSRPVDERAFAAAHLREDVAAL